MQKRNTSNEKTRPSDDQNLRKLLEFSGEILDERNEIDTLIQNYPKRY